MERGVGERRHHGSHGERRVPGVNGLHVVPPAARAGLHHVGQLRVVGLAATAVDDLEGPPDALHSGQDLELLAEVGDAHRARDGRALAPVGKPAAVPSLEGRRQRGPHLLIEAEAEGEGVGHLAGRAEVELGCLAAAGQHGQHRAQPAEALLARAGVAEHQAQDLDGVGGVGRQGLAPQLHVVAEDHRHLEGVAGAAEEAEGRGPPGALALDHVETGGGRQLLAEDSRPQLRARRLPEGMVLGDGQERGDLHLGDGDAHAATVDRAFTRCGRV